MRMIVLMHDAIFKIIYCDESANVCNDGDGDEDYDDEYLDFSPGIGEGVLGSTPPGDSFGGVGG